MLLFLFFLIVVLNGDLWLCLFVLLFGVFCLLFVVCCVIGCCCCCCCCHRRRRRRRCRRCRRRRLFFRFGKDVNMSTNSVMFFCSIKGPVNSILVLNSACSAGTFGYVPSVVIYIVSGIIRIPMNQGVSPGMSAAVDESILPKMSKQKVES